MTDTPPDRLSANPGNPFYDAAALERGVGVRFKGVDKNNVDEYCVSEGWVRPDSRRGQGPQGQRHDGQAARAVEPYFRDVEPPAEGLTQESQSDPDLGGVVEPPYRQDRRRQVRPSVVLNRRTARIPSDTRKHTAPAIAGQRVQGRAEAVNTMATGWPGGRSTPARSWRRAVAGSGETPAPPPPSPPTRRRSGSARRG